MTSDVRLYIVFSRKMPVWCNSCPANTSVHLFMIYCENYERNSFGAALSRTCWMCLCEWLHISYMYIWYVWILCMYVTIYVCGLWIFMYIKYWKLYVTYHSAYLMLSTNLSLGMSNVIWFNESSKIVLANTKTVFIVGSAVILND